MCKWYPTAITLSLPRKISKSFESSKRHVYSVACRFLLYSIYDLLLFCVMNTMPSSSSCDSTAKCIDSASITESVRRALQHIACFPPVDFVKALQHAYDVEIEGASKEALAQILTNIRLCAQYRRPLCQDTGIVTVFLEIGHQANIQTLSSIEDAIQEGVRLAYLDKKNPLRASVLADPAFSRLNTRDNTPAVIHTRLTEGNALTMRILAKGGGSENKTQFAVLRPGDSVSDWAVNTVKNMGAGWCPPGILGIGIGGTPDKAMLMAKEALTEPIDIHMLKARGATNNIEALRLELFEKINNLGIGAQGLGGNTTVFDVKIKDYPTHAASLPVALTPCCAATRHIEFSLTPETPVFTPPEPDFSLDITWTPPAGAKRIALDTLTKDEVAAWKAGDCLLLSGKLLTGRDIAHRRITQLLKEDKPLPDAINLNNRVLYYVGPVQAIGNEAVGSAGPTTAMRMDPYTPLILEKCGVLATIGKAERGDPVKDAIKHNKSAYLTAVGGAAYFIAKTVKSSRVIAFEDLGMEAMYEFDVCDFPVIVAIDSMGRSVHEEGPARWHKIHDKTLREAKLIKALRSAY